MNGNTSDGIELRSVRQGNQVSFENIEAVGNHDEGIDLNGSGIVTFDSVFACANEDFGSGDPDDIDISGNWFVTSWSDTTCGSSTTNGLDLIRNLRNLRCARECPEACFV